jgi:hypothetical protein
MGSGDKFSIEWMKEGFGLGVYFSQFPHTVSVNITLIKLRIYLGFGRGYDEVRF